MQARVTKVVPPGGRHSNCSQADTIAISVQVGNKKVPDSLVVEPGRYQSGQIIDVAYVDPRDPSKGFRVI